MNLGLWKRELVQEDCVRGQHGLCSAFELLQINLCHLIVHYKYSRLPLLYGVHGERENFELKELPINRKEEKWAFISLKAHSF